MEPVLRAILGVLAVIVGGLLLWRWLHRSGAATQTGIAEMLAAQGPVRCRCALNLLRRLAARGDGQVIAQTLDAIELPLVQVLPDCPPALKPELVDALDACAACTPNRAAAKRLVDLRNALLSPGAG
jgi:hypothetical protein